MSFSCILLLIGISRRFRRLVDAWNDACILSKILILLGESSLLMLGLCDVLTLDTFERAHFVLLFTLLSIVGFSKERLVVAVKPLEMWCDVGKLLSAL